MANLHIQESRCAGIPRIYLGKSFWVTRRCQCDLSAIWEVNWSRWLAKLRPCFARDFFWLSDSFIISYAKMLALRTEIISGVSTSTSVLGALFFAGALSSPTTAAFGAAPRRTSESEQILRNTEGNLHRRRASRNNIPTPIKRMTHRNAGKVYLVIS